MGKISEEIKTEALDFIKKNKGLKVDFDKHYSGPRISSEFMDCSMPMTFDHYSHCSLGCTYCFAYMFKSNNPNFSERLHSVDVKAIRKGIENDNPGGRQKWMYENFYKKRFLLHWGGMADPFCNFEKTNGDGYKLLKILGENAYPTLFSFKGSCIFRPRYQKLFEKYADQKNFAFQVSIITGDDDLARQVEIGVPIPSKRIKAIKMLSDMGYYTILRLRPFIIGITDIGLDELLEKSLKAGIQGVSMEFFAMDSRVTKGMIKRYEWLAELTGIDDIQKYFKQLSPKERGGYLRLNRLVKERFVKKVYQFCLRHNLTFGCSDPDFKELNTSGSCCAMPDKYPDNPELENWTKNQLTYVLKKARQYYHKKGMVAKIHFNDVFKPDEDTYIVDPRLANDHVSMVAKNAGRRFNVTYLDIARDTWNNLRSPGNPRNYFHGKMLPYMLDPNGDLIFKYNPSEYEERWVKEGINLKR